MILRQKAGSITDSYAGRMKLSYLHLMHVIVDSTCLVAPFALFADMGTWCVRATAILTLFYQGLLLLAKEMLDP